MACAAVLLAFASGVAQAGAAPDRGSTEAELKAVQTQIEQVRRRIELDGVERDRIGRDLRKAERSVATARGELARLRSARAEREAARAALETERRQRQAALDAQRAAMAAQLRAAYMLRRTEPLQLLLSERDPVEAARRLTYLGYLGRFGAGQVAGLQQQLAAITELEQRIEADNAELARLEGAQRTEVSELERARRDRRAVLAELERESRNRAQSLQRLQRQQAALAKLLKELDRVVQPFRGDPNAPFARLRGKLDWPVAGTLTARFGETRAGGLKWTGVMVAAERGAPVRAVHSGRVAYADWLPGLGLLLILDHGNGYLSLYGHNERLYKTAGAAVTAGETVAAAGDSGGRSRDELYFEIRRNGQPVDPRPWFRRSSP